MLHAALGAREEVHNHYVLFILANLTIVKVYPLREGIKRQMCKNMDISEKVWVLYRCT